MSDLSRDLPTAEPLGTKGRPPGFSLRRDAFFLEAAIPHARRHALPNHSEHSTDKGTPEDGSCPTGKTYARRRIMPYGENVRPKTDHALRGSLLNIVTYPQQSCWVPRGAIWIHLRRDAFFLEAAIAHAPRHALPNQPDHSTDKGTPEDGSCPTVRTHT